MKAVFTQDKTTKNTVRFTAPQGEEVSGSLYVQKSSDLASQFEIVVEILTENEDEQT